MSQQYLRLSPWRVGFAMGGIWGLSLLIIGLIAHSTIYYGHPFIQALDSVYIGYAPTVDGAFVGLAWGFCGFFIFGWCISRLYNMCLPRSKG